MLLVETIETHTHFLCLEQVAVRQQRGSVRAYLKAKNVGHAKGRSSSYLWASC